MKRAVTGTLSAFGMLLLIFNGKTALLGAKEAVELCLYTVIPSLFPFLVLSVLLNGAFIGRQIPFLRPLGRLCAVPAGAESLLLLGLIGGYPVGAQAISETYKSGCIPENTYKRLLGFCNNAGPSFVFGILAPQFSLPSTIWLIWALHIISALLVGVVLPTGKNEICRIPVKKPVSLSNALQTALKIIASICGWVIIFRVFISYINLIPVSLPQWVTTLIIGLLELTNGCVSLIGIESEALRFIICICLLNFGGLCVAMQTSTVCDRIGTGMYFPGKLLQTGIGLILAFLTAMAIF